MRKVTNFIVNKRYFILILFIIFTVISAIISKDVIVNYDMIKYLPNSSETKKGTQIMEDEFSDVTTSTLNIMFEGLSEDEKKDVLDYLNKLDGIDEIEYDNSSKYNKDDYTLYSIVVSDKSDSKSATKIYKDVTSKYENYKIYTSGDVADRNTPVLELWIIGLAVLCATIILLIMCDSYVEVFLFLITILIAVILNKGTNIIFSSVSNVTQSISAILQLALSMDYSIMLMNRYNQEKDKNNDKISSMKNALYHAFQSISSSSLTTIVGLIVLVFMSFTIGKDLGLVLAKGVLFSLISIFFVLPGLILMFDKWIVKTKKKTPHIKLNALAKVSYKLRYIAIPIFLIIFVVSYLLQGNLNILYTNSQKDKISEIFKENNQMAIVYNNKNEDKISNILKDIEDNKNVDEVLGYSNTINEKLTYDKLKEKMNDLGADVDIDDYLLKIIYYNYYKSDNKESISFKDFVNFIKEEVYDNDKINDKIDDKVKEDIEKLEKFITIEELNKKRSLSEIASVLSIDEDSVKDIMILYSSKHDDVKISISDFVKFMNKDVLTNDKYSSKIDKTSKDNLKRIGKFINKNDIQTKLSANKMATLFDIDKDIVNQLYIYYITNSNISNKMTLKEFSNFVINYVLKTDYSNNFTKEMKDEIYLLSTFSNKDIINKNMNINQLSKLFGIDDDLVSKILLLKYIDISNNSKLTIGQFIESVIYLKDNTTYLDDIDITSLRQLYIFSKNENNLNTTPLDKQHLKLMFDSNMVDTLYLAGSLDDTITFTPQQFVNLVITNFSNNLDETNLYKLNLIKTVIDSSVSTDPQMYSTKQISNILKIDISKINQIYTLIDFINNNTSNWVSTPYEFVNIIIKNSNNTNVSSNIDKNTLNNLYLLENIMNSSLNDTSYNYIDLAKFINSDSNSIKSIYALYINNTNSIKITPYEFVNFILNHKNDTQLKSIDKSTIVTLTTLKNIMDGVISNKKYSDNELSKLLSIDNNNLELLYGLYSSKYVNNNRKISFNEFIKFILSDVITNSDYSDNFSDDKILKLTTVNGIMNSTIKGFKYKSNEIMAIINVFTDTIDKNTVDLLYIYHGSNNNYDNSWKLTIEEFVNYINDKILTDERFTDFIDDDMKNKIIDSKQTVSDSKKLLVGDSYSRVVINSTFKPESDETFEFIKKINNELNDDMYLVGDSTMAYEMNDTFGSELNFITILTMIAIFIVVAFSFKSILIPLILVVIIQCAVYMTMGILSLSGSGVYFIAIIIVQSILMGATIDYAILYTSYYIEHRKSMKVKEAVIESYKKSIHTILTSSSILIIVTLIVANFATEIAAKICRTISQGTICSTILILLLLPSILASCDKFIVKSK